MDLLESILRTCRAEKYIENFKTSGIDTFTLKILNYEDLKIIGVEEEDVRQLILKHVSNLQIPFEKKVEVVVDRQYTFLVLNIMSMHLNKHFANLTYALKREDVDLCDVKLTPAVDCLDDCVKSLEKRLTDFEKTFFKREKKRFRFHLLFPTITVTALALLVCCKCFSYVRSCN